MLISEIIKQGLDEDLGDIGDITSNLTIHPNQEIKFAISNREAIVLCGIDIALQIFAEVEKRLNVKATRFKINNRDGDYLLQNSVIVEGEGNARAIFASERLVLNLMQHLSGISTITKKYVDELRGTKAKILDTRKTIPCFRQLQKYAVKAGGANNHRMALYDGILIKDNHIAAAGGILQAVGMVRESFKKNQPKDNTILIEVECDNLSQVQESLQAGADIIMLDNMSLEQISEAVGVVDGKAKIEVSGGIKLEVIRSIAQTGVDYISVGALTHSVKAVDIGLDLI